jgi:hypothetical protein
MINVPRTEFQYVLYLIIWRQPFDVHYAASGGEFKGGY